MGVQLDETMGLAEGRHCYCRYILEVETGAAGYSIGVAHIVAL